MEQPQAAEGHGDAVLVAGINDLLVTDGTAGLHDGGHTGAAGTLDVVAEGEEGVGTQAVSRARTDSPVPPTLGEVASRER